MLSFAIKNANQHRGKEDEKELESGEGKESEQTAVKIEHNFNSRHFQQAIMSPCSLLERCDSHAPPVGLGTGQEGRWGQEGEWGR